MVKRIIIEPDKNKVKKIMSINLDLLPVPKNFKIKKRQLITFKPGAWGGNHKHSRTEIFVSWDKLTLIWSDLNSKKHKEKMGLTKSGKLKVFIIEPSTPHAVVSNTNKSATLIEFADGNLNDVVEVKLV